MTNTLRINDYSDSVGRLPLPWPRRLIGADVKSWCPPKSLIRGPMVAEVNQTHRGVRCAVCHQPIPLSAAAARKDKDEKNQIPSGDDHTVKAFTLRFRACHREGLYMPKDVVDFGMVIS